MPRALDRWPTVAAPRAEDAESDGGHTIVLLGAGPFQDLLYKPALGKKNASPTRPRLCLVGSATNVSGTCYIMPDLTLQQFPSLVPILSSELERKLFLLPPCPTLLAPCGK